MNLIFYNSPLSHICSHKLNINLVLTHAYVCASAYTPNTYRFGIMEGIVIPGHIHITTDFHVVTFVSVDISLKIGSSKTNLETKEESSH